ncbi:MAG: hypothetical protein KDM63_12385, partial [Verrucomicrobiae bacterium]|nr:hypothetical protein [Verrucomicrobiae bacterium]
DPLAFPTYPQGGAQPSMSEPKFATAPETSSGPDEADPLAPPTSQPTGAPAAPSLMGPGEPAAAPAPPAEKPKGIFGRLIRRVW